MRTESSLISCVLAGRLISMLMFCLFPLFVTILQHFLTLIVWPHISQKPVMSPFHCNPFNTNCVVSPLMCAPKCDSTDLCIIHELSFPEGSSTNDSTSRSLFNAVNKVAPSWPRSYCRIYQWQGSRLPRFQERSQASLWTNSRRSLCVHTSLLFGLYLATLIC